MPLDVAVYQFTQRMLRPVRDPQNAPMEAINLTPGTYKGGTLLGQVSASASDVQTITLGSATGGTYTLSFAYPVGNTLTTVALAYNANAATIQAALAALSNIGAGNVAVTGTGPYVVTFGGFLANRPMSVITVNSSVTGGTAPTVAHTTPGVTGGQFKTYASGNSDGSQNPTCILAIDCYVDSSGRVTYSSTTSDSATGGFWGETRATAPAYYGGAFNTADLIGLDANAVTKLGGHLAIGTISNGVYAF